MEPVRRDRHRASNNRDWDFHSAERDDPDELRALYLAVCDRTRLAVAAHDLDALAAGTALRGQHWSLRWILNHLLEAIARHDGHADLLRESIDGSVGE